MAEASYVVGATAPALLEHTIGEALDAAVARWPDDEALVSVHQGVRLTWSQFGRRVDDFAAGLLALGVAPGDRVGVWAPNGVEWALAQFATARIGAIQVNINPAYRSVELEYTLRKVGVKVLVCAAAFKGCDYLAMVEDLLPALPGDGEIDAPGLPALRRLIKLSGPRRRGWLDFPDVSAPADAINIQFTSGTTGLPKGATLSHRNILNNAWFSGLAMGLKAGDRLCIPLPLYHCFGMILGNLACVVHGATMVYPAESYDALAVLQTVAAERCTGLHGVPTMFIGELEHPAFETFDLGSLRGGLMGGSPCPVEVMRRLVERMHMREVGVAYGMTETSPVSFQTAPDDPLERRVATIGRVQPHLEVKIVDPATGEILPRGQAGELCVRGYAVMLGYWEDPERTAEAVRDSWMHTGDLAVLDEAGYGRIVGRIKDLVIRGGENVYPREVEEFLYGHPKIEDVQVVGIPDPRYGEEVCAWIKLRAGEASTPDEIIAFCRGRIAHFKTPRHIRFIDAFPMTVTGKIQKYRIREAMIEELSLTIVETA
jgi:fatty-acyl-CoA synthase